MSALEQALRALSRFLVADASIGDTLHRIAALTVDAVEPANFVGMSMLDDRGKPVTAVFTDQDSPEIDGAQYEAGRGPCLDAWREQRVVRVVDTTADDQFPEFSAAAAERGILSTLSMPLAANNQGLGALNLYAPTRDAFSPEDEALVSDLATAASAVLANSVAYWGAYELSQHLQAAMEGRAVIEQAKGILMARSPDLDADGAFKLLISASQRENVKLREIAQRIVDRRPPPGP